MKVPEIIEYPEDAGLDIVGKYDGTALSIQSEPVPEDVNTYAVSRFSNYQLLKTHIEEIGISEATVASLRLGQGFMVTDLEQGDIGVYHFPVLQGNKIVFIFTVYLADGEYHVTFGRPNLYSALNNSYGIKGPITLYRTADGYAALSADGGIYVTYIFGTSCSAERTPEDVAKTIRSQIAFSRFSLIPSNDLDQSATVSVGSDSLLSNEASLSIANDQLLTRSVPVSHTISNFPWVHNYSDEFVVGGQTVSKAFCWAASDYCVIRYIYEQSGLSNYPTLQVVGNVGKNQYIGLYPTTERIVWGGIPMQRYTLWFFGITETASQESSGHIDVDTAKAVISGNGPIVQDYKRTLSGGATVGHAVVLRGYTATTYLVMEPDALNAADTANYYVDIDTQTLFGHMGTYSDSLGYIY